MRANDLMEALMSASGGINEDRPKRRPRPLHEAQIMSLRERAPAYIAPCGFKIGDLVTPRRDSPVRCAGEPQLVIDVRNDAQPDFGLASGGSYTCGARLNMRVLTVAEKGVLVPYWVEAGAYEAYDPAVHDTGESFDDD